MKKKMITVGCYIGYYTSRLEREIEFVIEFINGRCVSKEKRATMREGEKDDFKDLLPWILAKMA